MVLSTPNVSDALDCPGDFIVADGNGMVVVPWYRVHQALEMVQILRKPENELRMPSLKLWTRWKPISRQTTTA